MSKFSLTRRNCSEFTTNIFYCRNIASAGAHDGDVETHHHMFARWLYPIGTPFNIDDENEGLFQGHYLIYVSVLFELWIPP